MIFITAEGGLLGPLAKVFGYVMNGIYLLLDKLGIGNIGIAIIIFTLFTRLILYPFTVQQQKSSKIMNIIQPEIKAIQDKYAGRQDQQSMLQQQAEIKAVYEKYGTSVTGNCVQLLIQMPIIFALYRVIMNVPAYVNVVKEHFVRIVDSIGGVDAIETINTFVSSNADVQKVTNTIKGFKDIATIANIGDNENLIIDFLYKLNPNQLNAFAEYFSNDVKEIIANEMVKINEINSFCGLNLSTAPSAYGISINPYIIIPILAGLTQYLSVYFMQKQNKPAVNNENDENNQMQQTMKTMNIMMPLMSVVFCFGFATGIGVYWVASSVFMVLSQIIVNMQLKNLNVDDMIKANIEKANKKRAKKGLPKLSEVNVANNIKRMEEQSFKEVTERERKINEQKNKTEEATKYYNSAEANPDSLFAKANMVSKYNEKEKK